MVDPATSRRHRRLLAAALAITVLLLGIDLSGLAWTSTVRAAGAQVFGPVLRAVNPPNAQAQLRAERDRLADQVRRQRTELDQVGQLQALLNAPELREARLVAASVVAVGASGASGIERITIDVGSRDGVSTDQSVVTADGLVGRTIAVGPWTSDVLVLGAPGFVVGVRVGEAGRLGTVEEGDGASGVGGAGRARVSLVQPGELTAGDLISTAGSPGARPFAPGIPVGVVAQVDSARGALTQTATLTPAVDVGALSVVGVLVSAPRQSPRPVATVGSASTGSAAAGGGR